MKKNILSCTKTSWHVYFRIYWFDISTGSFSWYFYRFFQLFPPYPHYLPTLPTRYKGTKAQRTHLYFLAQHRSENDK